MKTLANIHKDQITKMINENERVSTFKAYCKGAGFDTTKYSSPIHISEEGKLTMRYRTINTYHYIRLQWFINYRIMKDLINWKQLSIKLSGSDNAIRKNQIPKKYQRKIDKLVKLLELWLKWTTRTQHV